MSAFAWAEMAPEPTFHDKTWCAQGHVMRTTDPVCPACTTAIAELASAVLENLHLGLIPALDPDPLIGRRHDDLELWRAMEGQR